MEERDKKREKPTYETVEVLQTGRMQVGGISGATRLETLQSTSCFFHRGGEGREKLSEVPRTALGKG
jgi:hypothetical protein